MSIYQKNIDAIKNNRPILFKALEPYLQQQLPDSVQNFLQNLDDEKEFLRSEKISPLSRPMILIFDGIGSGCHFLEKIKNLKDETKWVVVVEKDPLVFVRCLKTHDLTAVLKSVQFDFFIGLPENMMVPVLREYFVQHDRIIWSQFIEHYYFYPSLEKEGPYYVAFADAMKRTLGELQNVYLAPPDDGYRGLMNVVNNAERISSACSIDSLKDVLQGEPAVLVSSGPSLNHHLDRLKEISDSVFMACSDSALKILLGRGIVPDMVFSLERDVAIRGCFKDLPSDFSTMLATLPITHPDVLKQFAGDVLMLSREKAYGRWLFPERVFLNFGGSVATMIYRSFIFFGCSEIYLLGQDLAYDPQSKASHVQGVDEKTQEIEKKRQKSGMACELAANSGGVIMSSVTWKSFLEKFEVDISKFGVPTYNVIPENMGAKIQGAQVMSPDDFYLKQAPRFKESKAKQKFKSCRSKLSISEDCDVKALFEKSRLALDDMIAESLSQMDGIAVTVHENFPEESSLEELKQFQGYFHQWEQKRQAVVNLHSDLYRFLISPVFQSTHLRIMTSRESLDATKMDVLAFIRANFDHFTEWHKSFTYWCLRIRNLLDV